MNEKKHIEVNREWFEKGRQMKEKPNIRPQVNGETYTFEMKER